MGQAALLATGTGEEMDEALLGHVLRDPVMFQEFLFPDESPTMTRAQTPVDQYHEWNPGDFMHVYWSQYPAALYDFGLFLWGRGGGKTRLFQVRWNVQRSLMFDALETTHLCIREANLRPILMDPTLELVEKHPFLQHCRERISRDEMNLFAAYKNGSRTLWRGPGRPGRQQEQARGFEGPRSHNMTCDEVQQFNPTHLKTAEAQQLIDPQDPEMQRTRGAARRLFGVPDGLRNSRAFSYDTGKDPLFVGLRHVDGRPVRYDFRWKMPAMLPYTTRSRHTQFISQHECRPAEGVWTEEYKRFVWGMHGRPAKTLFPAELRAACSENLDDWTHINVGPLDFHEETKRIGGFTADERITRPGLSWLDRALPLERAGVIYGFGIDVGKTADTCIGGWYLDKSGVWTWHWLVTLRGWDQMEWQCWVVNYLAERFRPVFMGMDESTLGSSLYSPLVSNAMYGLSYGDMRDVLWGFQTNQAYVWGMQNPVGNLKSGQVTRNPDLADKRTVEREIFSPWAMMRIRRLLEERHLLLPSMDQAPEVHADMATVTRTIVPMGAGKYRTEFGSNHPHITSSIQFFVGGLRQWEIRDELKSQMGKAKMSNRDMKAVMFGHADLLG